VRPDRAPSLVDHLGRRDPVELVLGVSVVFVVVVFVDFAEVVFFPCSTSSPGWTAKTFATSSPAVFKIASTSSWLACFGMRRS
jgi:hypothetical protein